MNQTFVIDNNHLNYSFSGKGPVVLLIHGFLESIEIWEDIIDDLKDEYSILAIDLPGHGNSSLFEEEDFSMEYFAQTIYQLLDSLNINEISCIGHSLGGYVSLALLELYPHIIKGICLLHSTAEEDSQEKKRNRNLAIKAMQKSKQKFLTGFVENLFSPTNQKKHVMEINHLTKITKLVSVENSIKTMTAMRDRIDRFQILKTNEIPKYIIIGEDDPILNSNLLIEQAELTDSNYTILNNVGHMGFYEDKKNCLIAIRQFLQISF